MKLVEWNEVINYAKQKVSELGSEAEKCISVSTSTELGKHYISFKLFDACGNWYDTYSCGTQDTKAEYIKTIDRKVVSLKTELGL